MCAGAGGGRGGEGGGASAGRRIGGHHLRRSEGALQPRGALLWISIVIPAERIPRAWIVCPSPSAPFSAIGCIYVVLVRKTPTVRCAVCYLFMSVVSIHQRLLEAESSSLYRAPDLELHRMRGVMARGRSNPPILRAVLRPGQKGGVATTRGLNGPPEPRTDPASISWGAWLAGAACRCGAAGIRRATPRRTAADDRCADLPVDPFSCVLRRSVTDCVGLVTPIEIFGRSVLCAECNQSTLGQACSSRRSCLPRSTL